MIDEGEEEWDSRKRSFANPDVELFSFAGCHSDQLLAVLEFYASVTGFRAHGRPAETIRNDIDKVLGLLKSR